MPKATAPRIKPNPIQLLIIFVIISVLLYLAFITVRAFIKLRSPQNNSSNSGEIPLNTNTSCVTDEDCVWVPGMVCSDCSCGNYINKSSERTYLEYKKNMCQGYQGGICDMACPANFDQAACVLGTCTIKPSN